MASKVNVCNWKVKGECPLDGKCLIDNMFCRATIISKNGVRYNTGEGSGKRENIITEWIVMRDIEMLHHYWHITGWWWKDKR